MDSLLDSIWEKIAAGIVGLADGVDVLIAPFHFLGPATIIFALAFLTVLITRGLTRIIVTKRYLRLEKKFKHWYEMRQTALTCEDRDKGRALAKNIDQGKLNRAYYDYFFEGLLLGMARKAIPILIGFAYVNEYYRPERLLHHFGQSYVFQYVPSDGEPIRISSVLWYIGSLAICYLAWALFQKGLARLKADSKPDPKSG